MTEPHCFHLLVADSVLTEHHRYWVYPAWRGALLGASELPSSECEPGCVQETIYCQVCIRTANGRNYDAGLDVDCPPGVVVRRIR